MKFAQPSPESLRELKLSSQELNTNPKVMGEEHKDRHRLQQLLKIALFRLIFKQSGSIMALILKQDEAAPWNALWRKDIDVLLLLDNTDTIKDIFKQTEAQRWSALAAFAYEQPIHIIYTEQSCSSALP